MRLVLARCTEIISWNPIEVECCLNVHNFSPQTHPDGGRPWRIQTDCNNSGATPRSIYDVNSSFLNLSRYCLKYVHKFTHICVVKKRVRRYQSIVQHVCACVYVSAENTFSVCVSFVRAKLRTNIVFITVITQFVNPFFYFFVPKENCNYNGVKKIRGAKKKD